MSPRDWLTKFNYAFDRNDLKSLEQIAPSRGIYLKVKKELTDNDNARRRDIVSQTRAVDQIKPSRGFYTMSDYIKNEHSYTMDDYLKTEERRAGYLDSDTYSIGNRYLSNSIEYSVGDQVKFIAKDHYYENQDGIIVEKRGRTFLVEIISKGAPKTGANGMVRTTADCLEKRLAHAG